MASPGKSRRIFTVGFWLLLAASAFFFWLFYERYLPGHRSVAQAQDRLPVAMPRGAARPCLLQFEVHAP